MSPSSFLSKVFSLVTCVLIVFFKRVSPMRAGLRPPSVASPLIFPLQRQAETILHFDDISLPKSGLTSLPTPYHHLTFNSFSVFSPHSPALSHLISPVDLNCAVSSPNALLGARVSEHGAPASFEVANTTSTVEPGPKQQFTLQKMMIKPMAAPEPGTNLSIKGYREGKEPLEWSLWFPTGFDRMFEVKIEEYSKMKWDGLRKVEIWADFGYDDLDWEFCVDDLVVEFNGVGSENERHESVRSSHDQRAGQVVMQDG